MLRPRSNTGGRHGIGIGIGSGASHVRLSRFCLFPIIFFTIVIITTIIFWPRSSSSSVTKPPAAVPVGDGPPPTTNLAPPLSREELGRASWALLHTMAAKYPHDPTPSQQTAMRNIIDGIAELYPCSSCAKHFRLRIDHTPPDVSNRDGLTKWLCQSHNAVNLRNKKPLFACDTISTIWPEELRDDCGCKDRAEDAAAAALDHSAIADNNVLNGGPDADRYVARMAREQRDAEAQAALQAQDHPIPSTNHDNSDNNDDDTPSPVLITGGNGVVRSTSLKKLKPLQQQS